ncbi:hypothetical protein K1719_002878 [Acacia pycnantha]|nr:hypothetical protein K1719_002878 [Acacia pycnantha]
MASSIRPNPVSSIGIGIRPSSSPSFSRGNLIQNEIPTVGAKMVLARAPRWRNLRRTGLPEILRDLNKRIPDNIVKAHVHGDPPAGTLIPWYHANRMLSFYAPGWCGEIRDVIFSDNGSVTVVYRVTVRGSDGEAHREATGTVSPSDGPVGDPVATAEELAFCKACARFGLGLYLYHED